jgi:hypothetical protein
MNGPDTKSKQAKVLCKTQNKIKGVSACSLYLAGTIGVFQTISPSVCFRIY